jgi:glycosyltransferase involved in cell wall biosynthesis
MAGDRAATGGIIVKSGESAATAVSIVVTNYNYAQYVGAAIDSALAQTHPRCEVIVVDDGSTDDSRAVLAGYRDRPDVKLIFQDNGGQGAAFNAGFAAATGEFILFLDADDLLLPEAVAIALAHWRPGLSRCQFPLELIDPDGRALGLHSFSHRMDDGDLHWKAVVSGHIRFIPTSGNLFARAALAPLFPIPAAEWRLCADSHIVYRSLAAGPVLNLRQPLGRYRLHDRNNWYRESRDREQLRQVWRQIFQLWESLIEDLRPYAAEDEPPSLRQARIDHAALHLYRRLVAGHHAVPGLVPARQIGALLRRARLRALRTALPWRHRLLYLGCFLLANRRGWRFPAAARWHAHAGLRPSWLARLVERLKGADFYDWQSAAAPPAPVPDFILDAHLDFGRGRDGNRYLWHGWETGDPLQAATCGRQASLIGKLLPGGGDLTVEMVLTPVTRPGIEWQRLTIDANGARVYEGRMYDRTRIEFAVPRAVARRRDDLVLSMTMPDSFVARFLDDGPGDFRPQGFALHALRISTAVSAAAEAAGMYAPAGRRIAAPELHAGGALPRGWHAPAADGIARMSRAEAALCLTILDGGAIDHVLDLEFAVDDGIGPPRSTVEIAAAGELLGIVDVKRQASIRVLVPTSAVTESGMATLSFVPSGLWQEGEDWPESWPRAIGPGLRALRLEPAPRLAQHPVFRSGLTLGFDSGGSGLPFKYVGWHKEDGQGSLTADTTAELRGLWLDRDRDLFLTAVVYPAVAAPNLPPQQLTVVCNGITVAIYAIAEAAEITAIVPPGVVAEDGLLKIEFRVARLVRPIDLDHGEDRRLVGVGLRLLNLE